jgi:hypothetical protein
MVEAARDELCCSCGFSARYDAGLDGFQGRFEGQFFEGRLD